MALVDKFEAIAKKLNATASQVALAWILAEHPNCMHLYFNLFHHANWTYIVFPIPGTRSVARLEENAKGAEIKLEEEDVKEIRKFTQDADVQGDRYVDLKAIEGNCLPLSEWKGEA